MADQGPAGQDLAGRGPNRLGLGTLGDFAAWPARHVASRFGDAGEHAHRLARGLDPRPLARRPPPAYLFPDARPAEVTDDAGVIVSVTGRCAISAAPARLAVRGEPPRRVTGWAGPWPLSERWWGQAAARRRARFQLVTDDGRAWLAVVQDGRWLVEARYR